MKIARIVPISQIFSASACFNQTNKVFSSNFIWKKPNYQRNCKHAKQIDDENYHFLSNQRKTSAHEQKKSSFLMLNNDFNDNRQSWIRTFIVKLVNCTNLIIAIMVVDCFSIIYFI